MLYNTATCTTIQLPYLNYNTKVATYIIYNTTTITWWDVLSRLITVRQESIQSVQIFVMYMLSSLIDIDWF